MGLRDLLGSTVVAWRRVGLDLGPTTDRMHLDDTLVLETTAGYVELLTSQSELRVLPIGDDQAWVWDGEMDDEEDFLFLTEPMVGLAGLDHITRIRLISIVDTLAAVTFIGWDGTAAHLLIYPDEIHLVPEREVDELVAIWRDEIEIEDLV